MIMTTVHTLTFTATAITPGTRDCALSFIKHAAAKHSTACDTKSRARPDATSTDGTLTADTEDLHYIDVTIRSEDKVYLEELGKDLRSALALINVAIGE